MDRPTAPYSQSSPAAVDAHPPADVGPLDRSSCRLQALSAAAVRVQEALTRDEVLAAVGAELKAIGMECHFSLLTDVGDELVVRYVSLAPEKLAPVEDLLGIRAIGFRLSISRVPALGTVVRDRRAAFFAGETEMQALFPCASAPVVREVAELIGARGMIVAPLLVRGQVIGALVVWAGDLGPDDLPAIVVFAQQAATAYENARLYQQARAERQRLAAIVDQMVEGVAALDGGGRIVLINRAAEAILGGALDQASSGPPSAAGIARFQLLRPDGQLCRPEETPIARALRGGEVLRDVPAAIRRPDGRHRDLQMSLTPIRDEHADCDLVVGVFRDVTAERALEHAKDEFLLAASHELRSPLAVLKGYAGLLRRGLSRPERPFDREQVSAQVSQMSEQIDRLVALTEKLLDVARIQGGRLKLDIAPVDLVAVARTLLESRQPTVPDHRLGLRSSHPTIIASVDQVRVEQVLRNLVENAVKCSPPGEVVEVSIGTAGGLAVVQVRDRGVGIPRDHLPYLFEPFRQVETGPTRRPGGLGLGLAISKGLVEAQGGTIRAESEPGAGTTITFTLPL
ncbi:MAG: PAS domain-containing protein, partial [Chloroflexi bacterium]|nr:PAS domain-containing protein [Chloroflexota bacterium]